VPGVGVDMMTIRDWDEPAAVEDLKVVSRAPSEDAPRTSIQLALYSMARVDQERLSAPDWQTGFLYIIRRKKTPDTLRLDIRSTPESQAWAVGVVRRVVAGITAGVFTPALGLPWCGPSCEYFDVCMEDLAEDR